MTDPLRHPPADALDALALGTLPDAEAAALRVHVAACPACAAHVAEVMATLRQLPMALDPVAPSAEAKQRLLDQIVPDAPLRMPATQPRRSWAPWLTAVAAALVAGAIGAWLAYDARQDAADAVAAATERAEDAEARASDQANDLTQARDRLARLAADLQTQQADAFASQMLLADATQAADALRSALASAERTSEQQRRELAARTAEMEQLADRLAEQEQFARQMREELTETQQIVAALQSGGAVFVSLGPTDAAGVDETARVLLDPEAGKWYLFTENLPNLPDDQAYQFWLVDADTAPASAGLFTVGPDGRGLLSGAIPANLADFEAAAITPEPAGGSPAPTGEIRLLAELK